MKTAVSAVLAFLFFDMGIHGRIGSMLAAFIDPGALQTGTSTAGTDNTTASAVSGAQTSLTPRLALSVSIGVITQAQANQVLAQIARSSPSTPNLDHAIAQALADSVITGFVSASDAQAIISAQG